MSTSPLRAGARFSHRCLSATIVAGMITGAAVPALAAPTINPNVPDFYQHQFLPGNPGGRAGWEAGGGWCRPTALVDSLYSIKVRGYNNLLPAFDNAALTWQDAAGNEIASFRNAQLGAAPIKSYVASKGYAAANGPRGQGISVMQFTVDGQGNTYYRSAYGNYRATGLKAFNLYSASINRGDAINVIFGPGTNASPVRWWGNYHYVSGVGADPATNTIYVADPDSNKGSADANAGWNFTGTDANVAARRYAAADPLPIGPVNPAAGNFSQFYGSAVIGANGFQVDPANAANANRYKGIVMSGFETITPVRAGKVVAPLASRSGSLRPNPFTSLIDLDSQESDLIDKILLLPVNAHPDATFDDTIADDDQWTDVEMPGSFVDPLGEVRSFGGIEYDAVSNPDADPDGLESSEILRATIGTDLDFSSYDVLMHDAVTGTWIPEAIGAPEDDLGDQTPEPTAIATICAIGLPMLAGRGRRRRD